MSDRLKNKVGLISGAAQGLGKEMAKAMISQGADIIITDINEGALEKTSKELSCKHFLLDVTKEDQWKDVIKKIKNHSDYDLLPNTNVQLLNFEDCEFFNEDIEINKIDYYFSNAIARSSKTMSECRQIRQKIKKDGTNN